MTIAGFALAYAGAVARDAAATRAPQAGATASPSARAAPAAIRARAVVERHYFPSRPASARAHAVRGTLLSFGIGNALGSFTVRTPDGRALDFYVGYPLRVDGRLADCTHPPTARFTPSRDECPSWPRDLALGRARVVVRYWSGAGPGGEPARIGSAIDGRTLTARLGRRARLGSDYGVRGRGGTSYDSAARFQPAAST